MHLQLLHSIKREHGSSKKARGRPISPKIVSYLSVILYGPLRIFEHVGEYLDACGVYLQDPEGCNRNVRYRNPHRLSGLFPDAPWTIEQEMDRLNYQYETIQRSVDYLAEVDSKQDLPETAAPCSLMTPLFR